MNRSIIDVFNMDENLKILIDFYEWITEWEDWSRKRAIRELRILHPTQTKPFAKIKIARYFFSIPGLKDFKTILVGVSQYVRYILKTCPLCSIYCLRISSDCCENFFADLRYKLGGNGQLNGVNANRCAREVMLSRLTGSTGTNESTKMKRSKRLRNTHRGVDNSKGRDEVAGIEETIRKKIKVDWGNQRNKKQMRVKPVDERIKLLKSDGIHEGYFIIPVEAIIVQE